jgi:hypothetical protein
MHVSDYMFLNKYLQCKLAEGQFDISTLNTKTIFVKNDLLCISVIKTTQLMLYRQIVAVCSEVRKKHRNTFHEQNVESFLVKSADIQSKLCALKG